MSRRGIVIAGYYGFGNAGDELILQSLIAKFRRNNPAESITVLTNNPSETVRRFGVMAANRWRPWRWVSALARARSFILGGGGLFQETSGPWNYFYYLSLCLVAGICGCRTGIEAIGVDPIRRPSNRFCARFVLNHCVEAISVRDEPSRQALQDAGVSRPVEVCPDPVFDLSVKRSGRGAGGIALALSPGKDRPQSTRRIAEFLDGVAGRLNVAIDMLVFFPVEDEGLARAVARVSSSVRRVRVWKNPEDVLSWIPEYRLVVATRFHALVLAAMSQTPFIGWGPQKKVSDLCQRFGQPYWNTAERWELEAQANQIIHLYQLKQKSDILATRMG